MSSRLLCQVQARGCGSWEVCEPPLCAPSPGEPPRLLTPASQSRSRKGGFWRQASLGCWHPGVTLDPLVRSAWGSQLSEELALRGCPVSHPHPHAAHSMALALARRGLAQMPSNSVAFLPFFGLASPWLELPMGWSHHIPSTNRKAALWTKRGFFFLTPTFEFSAFSDSHVIRIL